MVKKLKVGAVLAKVSDAEAKSAKGNSYDRSVAENVAEDMIRALHRIEANTMKEVEQWWAIAREKYNLPSDEELRKLGLTIQLDWNTNELTLRERRERGEA